MSILIMDKRKLSLELCLNCDDPTAEEMEEQRKMAEKIQFDNRCEELLEEHKKSRYIDFLKDVNGSGISLKKSNDIESKRAILIKYFPAKYGKQRLSEYSDIKFNEVFLGFLDYAKKQGNK